MKAAISYSANRQDLYSPWKNAVFFPAGEPTSEASLCAELSRLSYCRQESSFAFDQEHIRSVLSRVGFTDCEFFESQAAQTEGTHCFLAIRKDSKHDQDLAVFVFRGTDAEDPTDLGDDIDVCLIPWTEGGKVHRGFARAFSEVRPNLISAIDRIDCRVVFTGHSLGAAMATLFSSVVKPESLYSFGSPRVGDSAFIATLSAISVHRYVDCCDLVSRMPPEAFGYVHVGDPYYIDLDRQVIFNPAGEVIETDQFRARESYVANYAWRTGNVAIRDLADHATVNYLSAIAASL